MRRGPVTRFIAGTALAASVIAGVGPAGALQDAPIEETGTAAREYCSGLDSFSVHRLYQAYFLREPDAGGLAYWQDVLASGRASLHGISQMFSTSAEFTNRYGSLTNRAFVRLVYRNVMGREGEEAGVDYWTGLLDAGHPRGTVMLGFSDSAEFKERTGLVPAVPAATDPPVFPEVAPYTVYPGAEHWSSEGAHRVDFYRYPIEVPWQDVFRYTHDQLVCIGWTVVYDALHGYLTRVESENGIIIEIHAFETDASQGYPPATRLTVRTFVPQ